jgi:ABC-type transport system substrate-binding protein
MMSRSFKALSMVAAVIAVVAIAACGSGSSSTSTPTSATGASTPGGATATATTQSGPIDLPAPKSPSGSLTWAWANIPAGPGINEAQAPELMMAWGVSELFFRQSPESAEEPWLATDWELAADLSKVTVNFRTGVQFHAGYGELTAEDVAWNLNNTNAATNPQSIHGQAGDYAPLFGEAIALDAQTLEIPIKQYDVRFASYFMNQSGDGFSIFSKKAFEEKGADWMRENIVATGPFQATEWIRADHVSLTGVENHWDKSPEVKSIRIIQAAESQSRVAMLLTGEVDLAPLNIQDLVELSKKGFTVAGTGRAWHVSIPMAGNYWEKTRATTGDPIDTAGLFNNNLPWQGNPNDAKDLDQARLVRNALARAIDRESIARDFFAGVAKPNYIGGFYTNDSNWQSKWEYPYDPAEAARLLDEAGFPEKGNGIRFAMPVLGQTDNQLFYDVAELVAGEWRKVGIEVEVLHYAYAVFRPTAVQRSNTTPITMTCRENNGGAPWDWPRLSEYTSLTRGGFGCSMEVPKFLDVYRQISVETDPVKRVQLNNDLAQYMWEQALEISVVTVPDSVAYNSKAIEVWPMRPGIFTVVNSPELIKLAK